MAICLNPRVLRASLKDGRAVLEIDPNPLGPFPPTYVRISPAGSMARYGDFQDAIKGDEGLVGQNVAKDWRGLVLAAYFDFLRAEAERVEVLRLKAKGRRGRR